MSTRSIFQRKHYSYSIHSRLNEIHSNYMKSFMQEEQVKFIFYLANLEVWYLIYTTTATNNHNTWSTRNSYSTTSRRIVTLIRKRIVRPRSSQWISMIFYVRSHNGRHRMHPIQIVISSVMSMLWQKIIFNLKGWIVIIFPCKLNSFFLWNTCLNYVISKMAS